MIDIDKEVQDFMLHARRFDLTISKADDRRFVSTETDTAFKGWLLARAATAPAPAAPQFDEAEFNAMVEKGTKAWVGVPDNWLEELRGNDSAPAAPEGQAAELTQPMFLAAERAGVSFATQQKCWNAWFGAAVPRQAAVAVEQHPPGTRQCGHCDGKGVIYQCVVCCSSEPRTGTCGSNDPRALCNSLNRADGEA